MELFTPEVGLIFWMLIAFLPVFFILAKFAWPAIIKGVEERGRFIDESIKSAKEANEKLATVKVEGEAILAKARNEQMQMLEETSKLRNRLIEEAKQKAQIEADKVMDATRVAIQKEKDNAMQDIRSQVALLSVDIAEKILRQKINTTSEQKNMVDRLLDEVNLTGRN